MELYVGLPSPEIERSPSHLAVLGYDTHAEVQGHVDQEQRVRKHVEPLPGQPAVPVQEGDLHWDPDEVEERDGHHAHDVVTPAGEESRRMKYVCVCVTLQGRLGTGFWSLDCGGKDGAR